MVEILERGHNINFEYLIQNHKQIIGISGKGNGHKGRGNKDFNIRDIKRVLFEIGEEKEAIKLFVDVNKDIISSHSKFRYRATFYPRFLYKYFIKYFNEGILEDVPCIQDYPMIKFKNGNKKNKFCQYIRKRCSKLLEDPDSLLHNCDLLNDMVD